MVVFSGWYAHGELKMSMSESEPNAESRVEVSVDLTLDKVKEDPATLLYR